MNSFQFFWGALVLDWKGFQELQCLQLENHFYAPFGFLLCPGVCSFAKREHLREGKLCWGGGEEAEIGPGDLSGLRWREAEFRRRLDQGARTAFGAREQALEARAGICVRVWCDLEGHHLTTGRSLGGKIVNASSYTCITKGCRVLWSCGQVSSEVQACIECWDRLQGREARDGEDRFARLMKLHRCPGGGL